jgi:starch synthase
MPSKFEPCGLNQIYSLKYGTVPIVRATGGLDDAIEDFNPQNGLGNGFKFSEYSSQALLGKTFEALKVYENAALFREVIQNGMKCDYSWEKSASQYEEVYLKTLSK